MMVLLDGEPFGKAGSRCKPSWMVFTLLVISVCKLWVRISHECWGLRANDSMKRHRVPHVDTSPAARLPRKIIWLSQELERCSIDPFDFSTITTEHQNQRS